MKRNNVLKKVGMALLSFGIVITGSLAIHANAADNAKPFDPVTVYQSPAGPFNDNRNYGARSPRVIQLEHQANAKDNGKLLLTFEKTEKKGVIPSFPIYESDDNGHTWKQISEVKETQHSGWGMANCPQLYELPEKVGDMPAGTVIAAGDATPNNYSDTKLEMYASTNVGKDWTFKSTIANGGDHPGNYMGQDPIWEPYIVMNNHHLVVFYSDERDNTVPGGSQSLVHQTSTDGVNWSPLKVDVAATTHPHANRPGMATIAKLDNGQYVMTMESNSGEYAKTTSDIENWVKPDDWGTVINHTTFKDPVVTNLNDGRIAYNDYSSGDLKVYKGAADFLKDSSVSNPTFAYGTSIGATYNRWILPLTNGITLIAGGDGAQYSTSAPIRVQGIDTSDSQVQGKPVTIHYVDQSGNTISPDDATTKGTIGDPYDVTAKAQKQISGYTFSSVTAGKNNLTGNFGADSIDITATYSVASHGGTNPVVPTTPTTPTVPTIPTTPTTPTTPVDPTSTTKISNKYYGISSLKKGQTIVVSNKKGLYTYKHASFEKANKSGYVRQNTVLKVKTVIKHGTMSRIQLPNGKYITGLKKSIKPAKISSIYYQAAGKIGVTNTPIYEYNRANFSNAKHVKHLKKGSLIKIKAVVKSGHIAKLQLTNGNYITARKSAIQLY